MFKEISIPALREEGDVAGLIDNDSHVISIPALREEGDLHTYEQRLAATGFLSPPSARRATLCQPGFVRGLAISIPALREEGDIVYIAARRVAVGISIPALREEGDRVDVTIWFPRSNFYPRPPRGGRPVQSMILTLSTQFLSPPSARRATSIVSFASFPAEFLSPPSARRATFGVHPVASLVGISIPALREEGDPKMVGSRKRY